MKMPVMSFDMYGQWFNVCKEEPLTHAQGVARHRCVRHVYLCGGGVAHKY